MLRTLHLFLSALVLLGFLGLNSETVDGARISLPSWHPDIDELMRKRVRMPSSHSSINTALRSASNNYDGEGSEHPNVDTFLKRSRPDWDEFEDEREHRNLNRFFTYQAVTMSEKPKLSTCHVDIMDTYKRKEAWPAGHPSMQSFFASVMPDSHPNIDDMFANPSAFASLPSWHITDLSPYMDMAEDPAKVSMFSFHKDLDTLWEDKIALTDSHVSVHDLMSDSLPYNHPNIDTLIAQNAAGTAPAMPSCHPTLESLVERGSISSAVVIPNLARWHPKLDAVYASTAVYPSNHPLIHQRYVDSGLIPTSHPNIDDLLRDSNRVRLPAWHPTLASTVSWTEWTYDPVATAYDWHPRTLGGESLPSNHPKVSELVDPILPFVHPDIDQLLADELPIPDWHPDISGLLYYRPVWRAGHYLSVILAALLIASFLAKVSYKVSKHLCGGSDHKSTVEGVELKAIQPSSSSGLKGGSSRQGSSEPRIRSFIYSANQYTEEGANPVALATPPVPPRPEGGVWQDIRKRQPTAPAPRRDRQLSISQHLHSQHRGEDLYDYDPEYSRRGAPPVTGNLARLVKHDNAKEGSCFRSCMSILRWRIPKSQWTLWNLLVSVLYIGLNVVALLLVDEPDPNTAKPDLARGFGSLAAANTMILIIPATRNSVLTWMLGLPFDQVVIYHRAIGRWTLICTYIHFIFFWNDYMDHSGEDKYLYGILGAACGTVIGLTTFDYVRRQVFNLFFFAHYTFIGFFVFGYLHFREARVFMLIGVGMYLLDRFIRVAWMGLPRKTIEFVPRGDALARIRFPKGMLTDALDRHRVGQYYFINIPALSLTEWHPFSVSSGPREESVEMHIRALGDHTKKIVEFAKVCEREKKSIYVRSEGPYGNTKCDIRRYPVILLVGGGVGITPILGILSDLFNQGDLSEAERRSVPRHCIESIYTVWVGRHAHEGEAFSPRFADCVAMSEANPVLPSLVVWQHITRGKANMLDPHLLTGRPNFNSILDQIQANHPGRAVLVFACGSSAMVNELWDQSIARTAKGDRFDFHHETFEF